MKDLIEQAKELMEWADDYGIDEIAISNGKEKIAISRNGDVAATVAAAPAQVALPAAAPVARSSKSAKAEQKSASKENVKTIVSPMVGTFYRCPNPEAPPFKEVGDRVQAGDTVCIVEAMKVMNQIKAPFDGVVKQIPVKNAEVVHKGQVLLEIV